MRVNLTKEEISTNRGASGLEISVEGFQGDSGAVPVQIFVEFYNGKLAVHVWDGSVEDCKTTIIPEVKS